MIAQVAGSGTAWTDTASSRTPSFAPPVRLVKLSVVDDPVAVKVAK